MSLALIADGVALSFRGYGQALGIEAIE